MIEREGGHRPETKLRKTPLTREKLESILSLNEQPERLYLVDSDLSGMNLEGKSFRGSDVRGMKLHREGHETPTNIRNTDWTNAVIGDADFPTIFVNVDAAGAVFGYSENLLDRRARHEKQVKPPTEQDTGALCNLIGDGGNFTKTKWLNADFGGSSTPYEAKFQNANFFGAVFDGCDLSSIDLSKANMTDTVIHDPVSLEGMRIRQAQVLRILDSIQFSDQEWQIDHLKKVEELRAVDVLKGYGIVVTDTITIEDVAEMELVGNSENIDEMLLHAEKIYQFSPEELASLKGNIEQALKPKSGEVKPEYGKEKIWMSKGSKAMGEFFRDCILQIMKYRGLSRDLVGIDSTEASSGDSELPVTDEDIDAALSGLGS